MATISVDFDGVLHSYEHGWLDGSIYGDLLPGAVQGLSRLMQRYAVFVHTTRSPAQVARWIEEQTGHGIECTTRIHPLVPIWWPGRVNAFWNVQGVLLVTRRKLPAVAYVDDRALRFTDWVQVTISLLGEGRGA